MQVSVQNIVFVTPVKNGLTAVFDVLIDDEIYKGSVRIEGFRYFEPTDNKPYVAPPAVKTGRAYVRNVKPNDYFMRVVFDAFERSWDALAARRFGRVAQ